MDRDTATLLLEVTDSNGDGNLDFYEFVTLDRARLVNLGLAEPGETPRKTILKNVLAAWKEARGIDSEDSSTANGVEFCKMIQHHFPFSRAQAALLVRLITKNVPVTIDGFPELLPNTITEADFLNGVVKGYFPFPADEEDVLSRSTVAVWLATHIFLLMDRDHDGVLTVAEVTSARLVLGTTPEADFFIRAIVRVMLPSTLFHSI